MAYFGLQSLYDLLNGAEVQLSTAQLVVLGAGGLINFVWSIFFLVWYCLPGTHGENVYGVDPKQTVEE